MKTVQDYLDFGLVFVGDDRLLSATNVKDNKEACMSGLCIAHQRYCDGFLGGNAIFFHPSEWTPTSFAWRNSDGVKPAFLGTIEIEWSDGSNSIQKSPYSSYWAIPSAECSIEIVKWRPVVLQSDDANKKIQEKFLSALRKDSQAPKNAELRGGFKLLREHLENKPPFWNKSIKTLNCPCVAVNVEAIKPTVSPKEDKQMKPVYTAEMHSKGELPPVGAKCIYVFNDDEEYVGEIAAMDGDACWFKRSGFGYKTFVGKHKFKPIIKTIKVNGFDVPAPMSENIKAGDKYFFPAPAIERYFQHTYWDGGDFDKLNLARGTIHKTQESAIAHAKAMLGIDPDA